MTDRFMVMEHELFLMGKSIKVNGSIIENMVKEHGLQLTERSILGDGGMERKMVKVHFITLMKVFL